MRKTILILCMIASGYLYAQSGELKGVIKDPTGSAIPFANITLQQKDSVLYGQAADIDGKFWFMGIPEGTYEVHFKSAGLKEEIVEKVYIKGENITFLNTEMDNNTELKEYVVLTNKVKKSDITITNGTDYQEMAPLSTGIISYGYSEESHDITPVATGGTTYTWSAGSPDAPATLGGARYEVTVTDAVGADTHREGVVFTDTREGDVDEDKSAEKILNNNPNTNFNNLLTAGEISDFTKWNYWQKLLEEDFKGYSEELKMNTGKRFTIEVYDPQQNPIPFASVSLFSGSQLVWQTITDNTGKAELWTGLSENLKSNDEFRVSVQYKGKTTEIKKPKEFKKGINSCTLDIPCTQTKHGLEIAVVVDATGSMDDEINYLKEDLTDILTKSKRKINGELTIASVFYRDKGEEYVTRESNFTADIKEAVKFISEQSANGGGDFPEAVEAGLEVAIDKLSWSDKENTKIMFLLLDAPPHLEVANLVSIRNSIIKASAKGIRIVPVICSGADKHLEYLMRSSALFTNGTYVFLTDHSGIGGTHLKPSTDKYDVYTLNTLMTNIIDRFTLMPSCENIPDSVAVTENLLTYLNRDEGTEEPEDTLTKKKEITVTVMPNPFDNQTNVVISDPVTGQLHLYDMNGKLLISEPVNDIRNYELNMQQFSRGTYFIILEVKGEKIVKKIIKS